MTLKAYNNRQTEKAKTKSKKEGPSIHIEIVFYSRI